MIRAGLIELDGSAQDICVIGAGPVGISLALELARLGRSVLLLESGDDRPCPEAQQLANASIAVPRHHVPLNIAVERRLGGTSGLWGGRCVLMDGVDFEPRPGVREASWPIGLADLAPYLKSACEYIGCGEPVFEAPLPGLAIDDPDFCFDRLERWSQRPRFRTTYKKALRDNQRIDVRLRATAVGFDFHNDGRVARVRVRAPGSVEARFAARGIVLAAGGLENTRLLLAARRDAPQRFGGAEGPLGRYYMGHVYGSAAEMVVHAPTLDAGIDYILTRDGTYIRRRFTPSPELQRRMALSNVSLWPDYPTIHDPRHRNGVLSSVFLSLSIPWLGRKLMVESIRRNYVGPTPFHRLPHMVNVLRDAPHIAGFMPTFLYRRYLARHRLPGFFQRNAGRRYALRFHAEHLPKPDSRVTLTQDSDAFGLPRLAIDLRYTEADTTPLIRAHDCFASWLRRTGLGEMTWSVPLEQRAAHIIDQCYDGHHQIGTTRMGETATTGVVGPDCRVFGAANLFVAGSSVFPTSGAANPTLTALVLAMRLAALLTKG